MTAYAHSTKDPSKADWEPLADHLQRVITFCCQFADAFGAAAFGQAIAALHDIGKLAEAFQRYLEGKGPSPDHSTAGAALALDRYGPQLGKIVAFCTAGHHAGLTNGSRSGGGVSSLKDRLDNAKPFTLPADYDLAPAMLEAKIPADAFATAFLIRMLFSCLVDADRLATEAFDTERKGDTVKRGWNGELTTLRDQLNVYLENLRGKGEAVDDIRHEILATVRGKADLAPGLFTMTVPTGGGKTLSSLAFALDHAIRHGMRRVIYVIPYTSVVEQTADVFRNALKGDDAVLEHHSAFDAEAHFKNRNDKDEEGVAGEVKLRQAMENWDRPVIVTTAVQFFESLFSNRPSACRKLHAIANSVVVLDEAQTLPLHVLRPCLAAIQELAANYKTSLVLCTATQPAVFQSDYPGFKAKPLKERLESQWLKGKRELAPDVAGLFKKLHRVTVTRLPEPLGDDDLAQRLADATTALCIVNNRRHARELTLRLREKVGQERAKEEVFHLSTCMCAAHRRRVLATVKQRLKDKLPTQVMATSLVEAGVDFSFPVVYRAVAGLESIAQAAGRCNRNDELAPDKGQVFVFEPAPDENHKPPHALKQFADIGKAVLKAHADPLSPDALTAYFKAVYWSKEDRLDDSKLGDSGTGVMQALKKYHETRDYPFADIGAGFRFIDSPMVPVIIPFDLARVEDITGALRNPAVQHIGGLARKLQPYVVQVPRAARAALLAAGSAEAIRETDFGDQFVLLTNHDIYFDDIGLDWSDPSFRSVESDIF